MQICMQIFDSAACPWHNESGGSYGDHKKKAVARKMTGRGDAFRPAQPLSVSTVRGRLGLSRKMFSRLAGFSERAIADWEGGKPVSEPGLRRIKELDRFRDRLSEVVAADAIPAGLTLRTRPSTASSRSR